MMMQRLRRLFGRVLEADREERLETLRDIADYYEAKAREARREISKVMSEPVIAKMREAGL